MVDKKHAGQPKNDPNEDLFEQSSIDDNRDVFDIENTSGINSVKGALKFMQNGLKVYSRNMEDLKDTIQAQAQIHNNSIRELRELIGSLQINPASPSIQQSIAENKDVKPKPNDSTSEIKTEAVDPSIAAIMATMARLEMKLDHIETVRSNGYGTVKKLAPDKLPGPRRPNNLLNCQDLRIEDLSCVDSPRYEAYI
ncbi:hypothetical protein K3495_g15513, partial [Podosphaera aphanis]